MYVVGILLEMDICILSSKLFLIVVLQEIIHLRSIDL